MRTSSLLAIACVSCAASGGSSATAPSNATSAAVHVPTCVRDIAWSQPDRETDVSQLVVFAGKPAYATIIENTHTLMVKHLDSNESLAEVTIPVQDGVTLRAIEVFAIGELVAVIVSATAKGKDGATQLSSFWLAQFDHGGRAKPPLALSLPAAESWAAMIAVGDKLVAAVGSEEMQQLVILDSQGTVVRSMRAPNDVDNIFAIGDTAFGVSTSPDDQDELRVFDLRRLDWVGPAVRPGLIVVDIASLGGEAVLLGWTENPSDQNSNPLSLASLRADGSMTPWRSLGIKGWMASLLPAADRRSAYLLWIHDAVMGVGVVGRELELARSPTTITPPPAGLTYGIVLPGSVYVSSWGRAERFTCTD